MDARSRCLDTLKGGCLDAIVEQVLRPPNWYHRPNDEDGFIAAIADGAPYDGEEDKARYQAICDAWPFGRRGSMVKRELLPGTLFRLVQESRFRQWAELSGTHPGPNLSGISGLERRMTKSKDTVKWHRFADVTETGAEDTPPIRIAWRDSGSVFATFRGEDRIENGLPRLGIVADAEAEARRGVAEAKSVVERVAHHVALLPLVHPPPHVLICYETDSVGDCQIPCAPDGGCYSPFRPVGPNAHPYGRTRPDLASPCPECPDCSENEVVHKNEPVDTARMWLACAEGE
jgi:hypothetical protein